MKKSFFNIEKMNKGNLLIYNTFTGAVISLDNKNLLYYNKEEYDKIEGMNTLITKWHFS